MQFVSWAQPRNFYLIMQIVPLVDNKLGTSDRFDYRFSKRSCAFESGTNDDLVSGPRHIGHRPKNTVTVPAKVRLKAKTKIDEFLVHPHKLLRNCYFEVFQVFSEREIDVFCVFPPECDGPFAEGLVKRSPQLLCDAGSQSPDFWREFILE